MHKNIKFTSEVGKNSLAFLDTYIELPKAEADSVKCSVCRKPTLTSLIMNFSAVCPSKWKIGLIQCLLHRAHLISSICNHSQFVQQYLKTVLVYFKYHFLSFHSWQGPMWVEIYRKWFLQQRCSFLILCCCWLLPYSSITWILCRNYTSEQGFRYRGWSFILQMGYNGIYSWDA